MADYTRTPQRFFYRGISLLPQDALPDGKVAYAQNIRSYQEGTITPRWGLVNQAAGGGCGGGGSFPSAVHSLFRLNDTSVFGASSAQRFVGAGGDLYAGPVVPGAYALLVAGFSGEPLTAVAASPFNSPRPYLYVADTDKQRKINSDLVDYPFGIATPVQPPSVFLGLVETSFLESIPGAGNWGSYGISVPVGPVPTIARIAATVTQLIYDTGATGFASAALDDMTGIVAGTTVDINTETVIVQEVNPPVSPTTIGRILYDVGTSGLCTIQPAGSFSVGQIEAPLPDEIRRRYEDLNLPVPPRVTVSRTVDFPVNSLVTLGGLETVRIQSVALGTDGKQSFRCRTSGTFAAGAAIDGVASFRANFYLTHLAGEPATAVALENTMTPSNTTDPFLGGIQGTMAGGERNWGLVGQVATQPSDIIRFSIRITNFAYLQSVRLMLNVTDDDGAGGSDFLHNYYFYEWRANDLLTAVMAAAATPTGLMADAQSAAVTQGQVDSQYGEQYGAEPSIGVGGIAPAPGPHATPPGYDPDSGDRSAQGTITIKPRTDGFVTAGATPSRQLSLGDNQWVVLQCRVGDLTRVGTDATKTLGNINGAAITLQVMGTTDPQTCNFTDCYLTGGYGPDVGTTLPPYVYRYRGRSTITGERSNPSPPIRGGVHPHRGRVLLTPGQAFTAPQCDTIDWFRFGGALARWAYVGSQLNSAAITLNDDAADSQIDGGEGLRTDLYAPWPTNDLPRSGTAELAGTALRSVGGDPFDPSWGADSIIIVNGVATALYTQPRSTTRLEVVANAGEGAAVTWSMPAPQLLGRSLPYLWGGPVNDVWFNFACGASDDPSILHWAHGNDPDSTSPANTLVVSTASEPLQNGCFFDGTPYVFSTNRLYRITPTFGALNSFRADETACTKGLWSPWAMALAPEGIYFLYKDGIYLTAGGGEAQSITEEDLKALFPQDGIEPDTIRTLAPVDMAARTRLKLTYVDSMLYFDYVDVNGQDHTLVYEPLYKRWTPDIYHDNGAGVSARIGEPGPQVHTNLMGFTNGDIAQADFQAFTDDGDDILWSTDTPWANAGDARLSKQWGDAIVDAVPGEGYTITPVHTNGTVLLGATAVPPTTARLTSIAEVNAGEGAISRNFGLRITGILAGGSDTRTILYVWEPAFVPKQTVIARRATDWDDLGYKGAKFIQGVVIRANTFNEEKTVQIQYEGGHVGVDLILLHDGETQYAYPLLAAGWTPFVAELVRLIGSDDRDWMLLDWRWVWEPAPEAATQWQTQETTFDLPGFLHAKDAVIAYQAHCPVTLTVWHETSSQSYALPTTNDVYLRYYLPLVAAKGKWVRFRLTANSPFRIFAKDTKVRVGGWGVPGGYLLTVPFGGPHRETGAQI